MNRTEAFEKAWRLGVSKKDFSLVDEIYHPDYKAVDVITGVEVNLEDDKAQIIAFDKEITVGPYKTLSENENFLKVKNFARFKNEEIFFRCNVYHLQRRKDHYSRKSDRKIRLRPQRRTGL